MVKSKKGAILQERVIVIILFIIVAAVIIALLIYENNSAKGMVDKEICHQSIVERSNSLFRGEGLNPIELIPLKCKTEEVNIDNTNEEDIKTKIVESMYNCWWMLGEGKLDFFSSPSSYDITNPLVVEKMNCLVCSTITFSEKVKEKNLQIDLASYLQKAKIPSGVTYLSYFSEGNTNYLNSDSNPTKGEDALKINTNQDLMLVYMQLKGPKVAEAMKANIGTGVVGGVVAFAGLGAAIGSIAGGVGAIPGAAAGALIGLFAGAFAGTVAGGASIGTNVLTSIVRCDTTSGCNFLALVPATPENLKKCQKIQSIP